MKKTRKQQGGGRGAFAGESIVGQMLGHRSRVPADLLPLFQAQQTQKGFIEHTDISEAAQTCRVSTATSCGVGTFYSLLDVQECGKDTDPQRQVIRICDGPSCCLRGGIQLRLRLSELAHENEHIHLTRTSCLGHCDAAPAGMVGTKTIGPIDVLASLDDVESSPLLKAPLTTPVLRKEDNNVNDESERQPLTRRFPTSPNVARESCAYQSLNKALQRPPETLLSDIEASGLRGRGGAGFNTGAKWQIVANSDSRERLVVCNADESEPGNFKDRVLMENDPHLLLEGMAICGYAVGANQGVIYIRGEYTHAADVLAESIHSARQRGVLGENALGSGKPFDVAIHMGAGAYICGEETALLESLEGKRGEPRSRPPYPTEFGYLGMPTVVNNVETLCAVPEIVARGADEYRQLGMQGSAGTKLFCLSGHVAKPGVCEAPLGVTLRELLYEFAGGMRDRPFKFAVTGGAAGTLVPESMLDVPLTFASWKTGVSLGSGGIMFADSSVSAVRMLLWILQFFESESCGKCTPCRIGTCQSREIVQRIDNHAGKDGDIDRLLALAKTLDRTSFCGLGQSVAWPIESAVRHFPDDFEECGAT